MKPITRLLIILAAAALVMLGLGALIATAPKNPVALIRVVDAAGKPIAGAVVTPEGLRTKPGPYVSGWYGWRSDKNGGVPNPPVTTDADGHVRVPYPKYVFERIETGTLCVSVDHPDYVWEHLERAVATAPPAGAPWRIRLNDLANRLQHNALVARADPIILQKGASLKITVGSSPGISAQAQLFAQTSGEGGGTNFWFHPEPKAIATRRLTAGSHTVRALALEPDRTAWFSEVATVMETTGQTNELVVELKRGATVRGQLDDTVPRPVKNGRVVVNILPRGMKMQDGPPFWHTWTTVKEDGSFSIDSLPAGDLEIVALCNGFISTNGPGKHSFRYPQQYRLGTNDLTVALGMEATARLEVAVTDDQGKPLEGVRVVTWPNVRYDDWGAVVLMGDCYSTTDWLLLDPERQRRWGKPVLDFEGTSDSAGVAVLPNLPADVTLLTVSDARYDLPATGSATGGKNRHASFTLQAGVTNHFSIQLEPAGRSPIRHY